MELSSVVSFAYAIFGIGIIIFIHELGHFLLAKRVGVRVERFSLGFDPTVFGRRLCLLSFRRGDTEYCLGALLFGGYVKMAGETAMDRDNQQPPKEDELVAKRPGQRALVFAAGAIFNILSAFIFFFLAFSLGVSFITPQIGHVQAGRPGWQQGLRSGDLVTAIDGEPVNDFHEIAISSALGNPDRPRRFTILRDQQTLELDIAPVWVPELGFHAIGVAPAYDSRVTKVRPESPAFKAGIREDDLVLGVRIKGIPILSGTAALTSRYLLDYLDFTPGGKFEIGIERQGEEEPLWLPVTLEEKPAKPRRMLGVSRLSNVVKETRPGFEAQTLLAPGDRVTIAGEERDSSLSWFMIRDRFERDDDPVELEIESVDGKIRKLTVTARQLIDWDIEDEVDWTSQLLQVALVKEGSPLAGKLQPGDVVVAAGRDPVPLFDPEGLLKALPAAGTQLVLWYRQSGETKTVTLASPGSSGLGIEWNLTPPVQVLPGRAAAKGKTRMMDGSRITEIDGHPIRSWDDLRKVVQASSYSIQVKWVEPGGTAAESSLDPMEGAQLPGRGGLGIEFSYREQTVQKGILGSFALGAKRTVVVGQHVFMTLKGLISRQVSPKNLAGPVGIIRLIQVVSEKGLGTLIYYLALISVNLGLFNLLPFPILDGGHLLFLGIEKIKGSPVDVRIQEIATTVAFFLIIGLAVFVTFHDLRRLITGL